MTKLTTQEIKLTDVLLRFSLGPTFVLNYNLNEWIHTHVTASHYVHVALGRQAVKHPVNSNEFGFGKW